MERAGRRRAGRGRAGARAPGVDRRGRGDGAAAAGPARRGRAAAALVARRRRRDRRTACSTTTRCSPRRCSRCTRRPGRRSGSSGPARCWTPRGAVRRPRTARHLPGHPGRRASRPAAPPPRAHRQREPGRLVVAGERAAHGVGAGGAGGLGPVPGGGRGRRWRRSARSCRARRGSSGTGSPRPRRWRPDRCRWPSSATAPEADALVARARAGGAGRDGRRRRTAVPRAEVPLLAGRTSSTGTPPPTSATASSATGRSPPATRSPRCCAAEPGADPAHSGDVRARRTRVLTKVCKHVSTATHSRGEHDDEGTDAPGTARAADAAAGSRPTCRRPTT